MLQYSIRGVKLGRKISFVAKLKCGPKYSENHKLQRVIFLLYPMVEHMHEPKEKGTRLQTAQKSNLVYTRYYGMGVSVYSYWLLLSLCFTVHDNC